MGRDGETGRGRGQARARGMAIWRPRVGQGQVRLSESSFGKRPVVAGCKMDQREAGGMGQQGGSSTYLETDYKGRMMKKKSH